MRHASALLLISLSGINAHRPAESSFSNAADRAALEPLHHSNGVVVLGSNAQKILPGSYAAGSQNYSFAENFRGGQTLGRPNTGTLEDTEDADENVTQKVVTTCDGQKCLFPFEYLGELFTECTSAGERQDDTKHPPQQPRPYCATSYLQGTKVLASLGYCECIMSNQTAELIEETVERLSLEYEPVEVEEGLAYEKKQISKEKRGGHIITSLLLGFFVTSMALLYLTNSSDPQIRIYTYKLLSGVLVIFVALAVCQIQHDIIHELLGHHAPLMISATVFLSLFLIWHGSVTICACKLQNNEDDSYAVTNILAHVAAFTAFEFMGEVQEELAEEMLHHSHAERHAGVVADSHGVKDGVHMPKLMCLYLLTPVVAWLVICLVGCWTKAWRRAQPKPNSHGTHNEQDAAEPDHARGAEPEHAHADGTDTPSVGHTHADHPPEWCHEAEHCEMDISAIATGFLAAQMVHYFSSGHVSTMDCSYHPIECRVTDMYISRATSALLVLCVLLMVVTKAHEKSKGGGHSMQLHNAQLHVAITVSWLVHGIFTRYVSTAMMDDRLPVASDSVMHGRTAFKLLNASLFTPLLIMIMIIADKLADRGFIGGNDVDLLVMMITFVIGFYWEKTFANAIINLADVDFVAADLPMDHSHVWVKVAMLTSVVTIITPAWKWYIVPTASLPIPGRDDPENFI